MASREFTGWLTEQQMDMLDHLEATEVNPELNKDVDTVLNNSIEAKLKRKAFKAPLQVVWCSEEQVRRVTSIFAAHVHDHFPKRALLRVFMRAMGDTSACEHCGSEGKVQICHRLGYSRIELVRNAVEQCSRRTGDTFAAWTAPDAAAPDAAAPSTRNAALAVDLDDCEINYLKQHLQEARPHGGRCVYFLCHACHKTYDSISVKMCKQYLRMVHDKNLDPSVSDDSTLRTDRRRKHNGAASQYKGVEKAYSHGRPINKWRSVASWSVRVRGTTTQQRVNLGVYETEVHAARMYDRARVFVSENKLTADAYRQLVNQLNFPEDWTPVVSCARCGDVADSSCIILHQAVYRPKFTLLETPLEVPAGVQAKLVEVRRQFTEAHNKMLQRFSDRRAKRKRTASEDEDPERELKKTCARSAGPQLG